MFAFTPHQVLGERQQRPYGRRVTDLANAVWLWSQAEADAREAWMQARDASMLEASWAAFEHSTAEMAGRTAMRMARNAALITFVAVDSPMHRAREAIRASRVYDCALPDGYEMADFERLVVQYDFDVDIALEFVHRHAAD